MLLWFPSNSTQRCGSKPASRTFAPKLVLKCFNTTSPNLRTHQANTAHSSTWNGWLHFCVSPTFSLKTAERCHVMRKQCLAKPQLLLLIRVSNTSTDARKSQDFLGILWLIWCQISGDSASPVATGWIPRRHSPLHAEHQRQSDDPDLAMGPHRGAPILIYSSQLGKHHLSITRPGLGHTGCVTGHTGQSACSGPWAVQSSRIHPV